MNKRISKVFRVHNSLAVVLPKDWTRGMDIEPGQKVEIVYNGNVRVSVPKETDAGGEPGQ